MPKRSGCTGEEAQKRSQSLACSIPRMGVLAIPEMASYIFPKQGEGVLLETYRHGGTCATLEMTPDLVGVIGISGVVTPATFVEIDVHCIRNAPGVRSWVADFTRASIALSDADLEAATAMLTPEDPFALPIAIVATDLQWDLMQRHVDRGLSYGLLRMCFSSLAGALQWAAQLAQLQAPVAGPPARRDQWPPVPPQRLAASEPDPVFHPASSQAAGPSR